MFALDRLPTFLLAMLLVVAVGFTAADPATRIAARTSLVARAADPAIRSHLLADWRRQSKRPGPVTAELSLVLLAAEAEDDRGEFRELLDTMPRAALLTWLAAICDTAVRAHDATAIAAVRSLASLRCFSTSLACRRGVIETLARIREPEVITALVDILEGLRGEARGDVVRHLAAVSGKQFGTDVEAWRTWFAAHDDAAEPMPAEGTTATSDALQAAFTFDAEAIFMLSDGEPSAGRIVDPAGIIQFVKELNRGRAVTVNTVGIMTGGGFLDELAKANHGTFRAVAE